MPLAIGQRVSVKHHPFNGVIIGIDRGPARDPVTKRRLPETQDRFGRRTPVYDVEHDNGDVGRWAAWTVQRENQMEALARTLEKA